MGCCGVGLASGWDRCGVFQLSRDRWSVLHYSVMISRGFRKDTGQMVYISINYRIIIIYYSRIVG